LYRQGWVADNWPKQHGGTGWSATQRHIFARECALAGAPRLAPFGLKMVAPVIYSFGNDAQKSRFLPSILDASCWWCQGYSEPGAGSDLAALRTRAERDGDSYIVNGSKTWTTYAQWADWIFCLVKTGEPGLKPQRSISFLLIDMKTPGISVRPIKLLDGGHEVNEVFFDNVRVPLDNRIGEEGKGWTYAKLLLTHERTGIAQVAFSRERLQRFKALFKTEQARGITTATQALLTRTAQVEIELDALEMTELRCLAAVSTGAAPGPESSILKIKGSEIMQSIDELFLDLAGHYGLAHRRDFFVEGEGEAIGPWYAAATGNHYFNNRKVSIYGGSNEIQKNIIAKQVLGI
jgi:alkylation response protein AidB-like acyl-CoA dehydrogenase